MRPHAARRVQGHGVGLGLGQQQEQHLRQAAAAQGVALAVGGAQLMVEAGGHGGRALVGHYRVGAPGYALGQRVGEGREQRGGIDMAKARR